MYLEAYWDKQEDNVINKEVYVRINEFKKIIILFTAEYLYQMSLNTATCMQPTKLNTS
jgi:hypothetical protein